MGSETVFEDNKVIIKLIPLETNFEAVTTKVKFKYEIKTLRTMSELKLGPKLVDAFMISCQCTNKNNISKKIKLGIIIQEKWDVTLENYMKLYPKDFEKNRLKISDLVKEEIDKYLHLHITHPHTKPDNTVMKIRDGEIKALCFIDFGELIFEDARSSKKRSKIMWVGLKEFSQKKKTK